MSQFTVTNLADSGAGSLRSQTSQPDVDAAGGQVGQTVTWTYRVTNPSSADAPAPPANADTTDQDFALVIYNAVEAGRAIITSIDSVTSNEPVNSTDDGLGGSSGTTGWFRYATTNPGSLDQALDDGLMTTAADTSIDASGQISALVFEGDRYDARQAFLKMLTADYVGSGDTDASADPGEVILYSIPITNSGPFGDGGWLIGDGFDPSTSDAAGNWIWNVEIPPAGAFPGTDVGSISTALADDSVGLIGKSDALAPTDFFVV